MAQTTAASPPKSGEIRALYDKLEDRILARDQVGASEAYYRLVRNGRPLPEILILRKVLKIRLIVTFVSVVGLGILIVGYLFNMII